MVYLGEVEKLGVGDSERHVEHVAILAKSKTQAHKKLREVYPYYSKTSGYSIYVKRYPYKLIL